MSAHQSLNIFYMYCYAWRLIREGKSLVVGAIDSPDASEFFARILVNGVRVLLRRGLEQGYREIEEDIFGLRGRVLAGDSYRQLLVQQGRTLCRFDEMGHDTPNNRLIKATLERMLRVVGLQKETHAAVASLTWRLSDVASSQLSSASFAQIALHRNNAYYALVLKVCELIFRHLLPNQTNGSFTFMNPVDDETRMSTVFEEFIRVFCQTELDGYTSVHREDIQWVAGEMDNEHQRLLPKMQTDATLRSAERTLIIDAKFYRDVFISFREAEKIRSSHLYQMFAYLKNMRTDFGDPIPEGLLLYPSSRQDVTLRYELVGHHVGVATLDLEQEWSSIERRLRELLAA